ncbi:MAG: DUF2062 domain-containing protein [Patescibacteria group bacterium]|nr:DUF2062 domain-containing protein [Patescibacteria group bacterium]
MRIRSHRKRMATRIRQYLHDVNETKSSQRAIALGFAIGTLIAILPFFGLGIFVALLVVLIYRDVNKLALFGALALWNPVTLIPIYTLSYSIGDMIFGSAPIVEIQLTFFDQVHQFTRRFLLGNVLLAASFSLFGYFFMYKMVHIIRKGKLITRS